MTFKEFAQANKDRCTSLQGFNHPLNGWSTSDWAVAVMGELGEASNLIKKLNRVRDGIPGNKGLTESQIKWKLAEELADTFIYLDLLFQALGLDIEDEVRKKFNQKSNEIYYQKLL